MDRFIEYDYKITSDFVYTMKVLFWPKKYNREFDGYEGYGHFDHFDFDWVSEEE